MYKLSLVSTWQYLMCILCKLLCSGNCCTTDIWSAISFSKNWRFSIMSASTVNIFSSLKGTVTIYTYKKYCPRDVQWCIWILSTTNINKELRRNYFSLSRHSMSTDLAGRVLQLHLKHRNTRKRDIHKIEKWHLVYI